MGELAFPLTWRGFHVAKRGNTAAEYEDAFAGHPKAGRFALADGASESAFAGAWARILVRTYVRQPGSWSEWLPLARRRWRAQVEGKELPWYAEAKVEEGAFATLLGLAFEAHGWEAEAVGDCCVFQVRGDHLRRAFPMRHARDFSNRPHLLGSRSRGNTQLRTKRTHCHGEWAAGDVLYLMTDALAQWFLTQVEDRRRPWEEIHGINNPTRFAGWVENLRRAGTLRNDDVTLVRIREKTV
jgi:hypothetical protein